MWIKEKVSIALWSIKNKKVDILFLAGSCTYIGMRDCLICFASQEEKLEKRVRQGFLFCWLKTVSEGNYWKLVCKKALKMSSLQCAFENSGVIIHHKICAINQSIKHLKGSSKLWFRPWLHLIKWFSAKALKPVYTEGWRPKKHLSLHTVAKT